MSDTALPAFGVRAGLAGLAALAAGVTVAGGAGGCARTPPRTEMVLLRCELPQVAPHPAFGLVQHAAPERCWFQAGWSHPDLAAHEVWSVGPRSELQLLLAGRKAVLRLECTTAPALVADGPLRVDVRLNGQPAGGFTLERGWDPRSVAVALPDAALRSGMNELALLPARALREGDVPGETRPLALLVRVVEVRAQLNESERRRYDAMTRALDRPAGESAISARPPGDAGAATPATAAPDVLVLLLDAARADHFGSYGYPRATTPQVDALAAGGVVLRHVYTPATYTLSAVTSLFTGRSWEDHGVVERGNALADSFDTLAEQLHAAGYHTMAFSPNPFVSRRTGLAQGFDEFFELWRTPEPSNAVTTADPEPTVRSFRERLARGVDPTPCFAYLHLLPPHEPYTPGPPDDLWTDAAYVGPVDGTSRCLQQLLQGAVHPSPADLQHLRDLYDGNLHRADAAVGRALEAWRRLGRPRELVVVVLADHGDALGEHGGYGHNLSVYDEVSHVPVVLWPAARWTRVADPRALRSLADVMPMLLGNLGIPPPVSAAWPTPFREAFAHLDPARAEVLVRSVPAARAHGIRTAQWLAVTDGWALQELFDTEADPAQLSNVRVSQPSAFGGLVGTLFATVQGATPATPLAATQVPPPPDQQAEEALRSLGYQ